MDTRTIRKPSDLNDIREGDHVEISDEFCQAVFPNASLPPMRNYRDLRLFTELADTRACTAFGELRFQGRTPVVVLEPLLGVGFHVDSSTVMDNRLVRLLSSGSVTASVAPRTDNPSAFLFARSLLADLDCASRLKGHRPTFLNARYFTQVVDLKEDRSALNLPRTCSSAMAVNEWNERAALENYYIPGHLSQPKLTPYDVGLGIPTTIPIGFDENGLLLWNTFDRLPVRYLPVWLRRLLGYSVYGVPRERELVELLCGAKSMMKVLGLTVGRAPGKRNLSEPCGGGCVREVQQDDGGDKDCVTSEVVESTTSAESEMSAELSGLAEGGGPVASSVEVSESTDEHEADEIANEDGRPVSTMEPELIITGVQYSSDNISSEREGFSLNLAHTDCEVRVEALAFIRLLVWYVATHKNRGIKMTKFGGGTSNGSGRIEKMKPKLSLANKTEAVNGEGEIDFEAWLEVFRTGKDQWPTRFDNWLREGVLKRICGDKEWEGLGSCEKKALLGKEGYVFRTCIGLNQNASAQLLGILEGLSKITFKNFNADRPMIDSLRSLLSDIFGQQ